MNRKALSSIIIILCVALIFSCDKIDEENRFPKVQTLPISNISQEGVELKGEIISLGKDKLVDCGFIWAEHENPSSLVYNNRISLGEIMSTRLFSANLDSGMQKGKTYYARAYLQTVNYYTFGKVVSFISEGSKPSTLKVYFSESE